MKPTQAQTARLCTGYLLNHPGSSFTSISASQSLRHAWGVTVDWHEMSSALDALQRQDLATPTGRSFDRQIEYQIHGRPAPI